MNKLVLFILLFCIIVNYCLCATWRSDIAIHKDHPDKCYDDTSKHLFSPGETYKPIGHCAVLHCDAPGKMHGYSCGKALIEGCKNIGFDLTKPHPYCCERFLCTDENGKEFIRTPSVPRITKSDVDSSKTIDNNKSDIDSSKTIDNNL